jgi:hypothetical protein
VKKEEKPTLNVTVDCETLPSAAQNFVIPPNFRLDPSRYHKGPAELRKAIDHTSDSLLALAASFSPLRSLIAKIEKKFSVSFSLIQLIERRRAQSALIQLLKNRQAAMRTRDPKKRVML